MLVTTYPFRPFSTSFERRFDRAFAQLAGLALGATGSVHAPLPAVSGQWADGAYSVTVDLPGVPRDALSVSVTGRTLVLDVATDTLTWNERIRLPQSLDVEQVSASYVDGRLTVTIPAAPEAQPRKVEIGSAPAQPQLEPVTDSQPVDTQAVDASATSATE